MKRLFICFLLAAGAMLLSVASYGQAINSVPYTISQPGNYFLIKNLTYSASSGVAIAINSSNVTLDFNDHVLTGPSISPNPTDQPKGVALAYNVSIENVTIRNGTILGFADGIDLAGASGQTSTGHVVEGMHTPKNTHIGIFINYATGCLISNNYVNNVGDYGIAVAGPSDQLIHNRVSNCDVGINGGFGNYLEDNFVSNCRIGFNCTDSSPKLRFNTTINCTTPFIGGTQLTDENN
jgi:parallel beta-helix repeat protein